MVKSRLFGLNFPLPTQSGPNNKLHISLKLLVVCVLVWPNILFASEPDTLPGGLIAALKIRYPDFSETEESNSSSPLQVRTKAEEDFNGDGRKDFALVLISNSIEMFSIMQATRDGYVSVYEHHQKTSSKEYRPGGFYIGIVDKGVTLNLEECDEESGCKIVKVTTKKPCIELGEQERYSAILCHENANSYRYIWHSGNL